MNSPGLQIMQVFTERMLNAAPEGMILACLVGTLLRRICRQNAATRFAIWLSALAGIVALPFFAGSGFGALHSPLVPRTNQHSEVVLSGHWGVYLFVSWAAGAGLLLLRLCVGLWHVFRLRSDSQEVDLVSLDPTIAGMLRDFAARSRAKLYVSKQVSAPAAIGFFQPAIVFPAWLLPQLSAAEIRLILLHEGAHLRRWDLWTNLAQKIVTALFFFHPAVWWISNRLTLEREMACDDIVLAQTARPKEYASFLISFAEKLQNAKGLALAQALVSRMRQISERVVQILDAKRPSHTGFWKPGFGVSVGLLAVVFGTAPYVPQLVALQNQPRPSQPQQFQAKKKDARSVAVASNESASHAGVTPATRRVASVPRSREVRASFSAPTAVVRYRSRATLQPQPIVMRAKAAQKGTADPETFVIIEDTEYDSSSSKVWTFCIWRVEGGNLAARPLASAIVLVT